LMLAGLAVIGITAAVVYAASVHFVGRPTFTDNGTTLTVAGRLAGLGNEDLTITVTAQGTAIVICTNPGGQDVPGQNRPPITATASQNISAADIMNGHVDFSVTTPEPPPPTPEEAGCPNPNWTTRISDVVFTSVTITVIQGGQTVLTRTFNL